MQEVQPTPKAPAVTGVYPQIRRPRPAEQVPESGPAAAASYLAIALDDGHLFIALLRGFTSALSTACPHHACAPHREKVMSEVQSTPKILIQVPVQVLLSTFVGEQRLRPGRGEQVPGNDRAVLICTSVAAIGPRGGRTLAPLDEATAIWRSRPTAEPDYIPGFYADVIPDPAVARPFTRPGLGSNCAPRNIAAQRTHAQRMHALQMHTDPIPALRIPAHCQLGERARMSRLRRGGRLRWPARRAPPDSPLLAAHDEAVGGSAATSPSRRSAHPTRSPRPKVSPFGTPEGTNPSSRP